MHVCGFAVDDKGPTKSLLQWPRPMLYSHIADLSRWQVDMLIVFSDPGLNKMYSMSTVHLTTRSRCHTHLVFMPRSFFMEGRMVKLCLPNYMVLYYSKGFLYLYSNKWPNLMEWIRPPMSLHKHSDTKNYDIHPLYCNVLTLWYQQSKKVCILD
jgi:hypothetical protein